MGPIPKKLAPWLAWVLAALAVWALVQGAWPLIWRLVILPGTAQDKHGLRVAAYAQQDLQGRPTAYSRAEEASLTLEQPHSSLRAHGVWVAPASGVYRLRLECDDYGSLRLDHNTLIELHGVSDFNHGQAEVFLEAGPHLLILELDNVTGAGWLKASYQAPGQEAWRLMGGPELGFIELGNFDTWLKLEGYLGTLPWWILGLAFCIYLVHRLLGWLAGRPAPSPTAGGRGPRPLFRLSWVLGSLGLLLALLASADLYLHHLYDLQGDYYNRRGYRGPLVGAKPPGEFRVAIFGGSGAYGYGQPNRDTLPMVLGGLLQAQGGCPVRVLNLAANQQGIYGIYHDVRIYQDLGYDLAVLYLGGADALPFNPQLSNFRGGNAFFRVLGYMPIISDYLDEKRVFYLGDLAGLAQAARGGGQDAVNAPVRFLVGQAMTQANQVLQGMARTLTASEEEARRGAAHRDKPHAFFLDYTGRTLDWLLSHGKQVMVVGEAAMSGSLQQDMLLEMLRARFGERVLYLDAAKLINAPTSEAFTDGVHFTFQGAHLLAEALAPYVRQRAGCPAAQAAPAESGPDAEPGRGR